MDTATSVLTELLRLYDWRFFLGEREKDPRAEEPPFQDETNRLLRQYGTEKKAAWEAARRVLGRRKNTKEVKSILEGWHKTEGVKQGHHPDEMCCDITEAIYLLERGENDR